MGEIAVADGVERGGAVALEGGDRPGDLAAIDGVLHGRVEAIERRLVESGVGHANLRGVRGCRCPDHGASAAE